MGLVKIIGSSASSGRNRVFFVAATFRHSKDSRSKNGKFIAITV